MPAGRGSLVVAFAAAVWTALAAWLSCGSITFAGAGGPRFGVLPGDALHAAIAVAAGLVVFAIARRVPFRAAVAVAPLALTILPWLPIPVPPAFLIDKALGQMSLSVKSARAGGAIVDSIERRSKNIPGNWG